MDAPSNPQGGPDPSILIGKLPPNYKEGQIKRKALQSVVEPQWSGGGKGKPFEGGPKTLMPQTWGGPMRQGPNW